MGRGRSDSAIGDGWQTDALADAVASVVDAMGLSVAGGIRAADEMLGLIAWAVELQLNVGVDCDNSVIRSRGTSWLSSANVAFERNSPLNNGNV